MTQHHLETPTEAEADQIAGYARECYSDYLAEFRESYQLIEESADRIVFADASGHGINEWAQQLGIGRERILAWMYQAGADETDRDWSYSDPIVLLRDDYGDFQRVEELLVEGLSPAQAIDYHSCEECGWSQTAWAKRRGVTPPAVSDNVGQAREKLGLWGSES